MRIELALLAALGTMACTAEADGLTPSVEDTINQVAHQLPAPQLQDIASKPTSDLDPATVGDLTTEEHALDAEPCPPCGRG